MLSVLCLFSSRGDKILEEKYNHDIPEDQLKLAVSKVLTNKQSSNLPCYKSDDVYVFSIKREKIIYIAVSKREMSNIVVLQFLDSFYTLIRNFCGGATEDFIRKNLLLIHELMTECVDNGFIKTTNIDQLRPYIYSDPALSKECSKKTEMKPGPFGMEKVLVSNASAERPLVKSRSLQSLEANSEVFIDVIEKITAQFSKEGLIQRFFLDGVIHLKSFITLNHKITVMLEENSSTGASKTFLFDQCQFDKCVDKKDFEKHQTFVVSPSQGEIKAMIYSLENPVILPFRLTSNIQKSEMNRDCDLTLKLFCNLPPHLEALNLSLHIPVSSATRNIMQQFSMYENSAEFISKDRKILWRLKKLPGQGEVIAKFKLIDALQVPGNILEMGPVALEFEASNCTSSGLSIRNIKASDPSGKSIVIQKWVRYVTLAKSYVFLI